tara:strand:- start:673 stop:3282 length:2610 start_codon:yes stop_codon:yes gene_type:complete
MSKIYDKQLVYIPSDLVGNKVVDKLRKNQTLQTPAAQSFKDTLFAGIANNSTFIFKESETTATSKRYRFQLAVDDLFAENIKMGAANPQKFIDVIDEVILEPIATKDPFFDVSFMMGDLVDRTMLLPSDATQAEKDASKADTVAGVVYENYKVQSHYTKYVADDPFERFVGNTSTESDYVPSFYSVIEANFYDVTPDGLKPNTLQADLNFSVSAHPKQDHIIFLDFETYKTFLEGSNNLANGRLKSLTKWVENYSWFSHLQSKPDIPLPDYFPFYIKTQFSTEKNSKNGFSFSSFLNSPSIQPFFKQFVDFYAHLAMTHLADGAHNATYEKKPWLDSSENYEVFNYATGEEVSKFNTKIIRGNELLKDNDFFNNFFEKSGGAACSNIKTKLSTILFQKKIKELILSVLDNNTDFWLNPNYSETICYRVTRTDKFTNKKTHWFVPNFPQLNDIELFDSNGRFNRGQDIKYEVFALKATIGVDYLYRLLPLQAQKLADLQAKEVKPIYSEGGKLLNLNELKEAPQPFKDIPGTLKYYNYVSEDSTLEDLNNYFSNFDGQPVKPINLGFEVEATPSVNFVEVPYFAKDGIIIYDAAPARPNMSLFGYKGVDDKITAIFGGYIDQYKAKRETILLGEDTINDKSEEYTRQFYSFAKDELYYKSEMEDVDTFELFVLEERPTKLQDFRNGKQIEIKNTTDPITIGELKSANKPFGSSYTLDVEPNKDYWIMSRIKDFTGNISNCSTVYKINIINDDGYINPTFRTVDLEEVILPKEVDPSPEFKKLLYIAPAPEHTIAQRVDNGIAAGLGDVQPYAKTYKVRITSKKTNKKIDINVYFDKQIKTINSQKDLPAGFEYEEVEFGDGYGAFETENP